MTETEPAEEHPGRGKDGKFTRTLDGATKDALAVRLRTAGYGYLEIANKLGYANESGAYKAVQRALAAVPVEDVTELRALEAARLDRISEELSNLLLVKVPLVVDGRWIVDQNDKSLRDPASVVAIVDRLLRVSEQRARLFGLNAPAPEAPKRPRLELSDAHIALLQQLLEQIAPADLPAPLALPTAAEKTGEAL